ncbi:phage virion morphogenesis protein [Shewanella sp. SM73]|jgi:phage virion morphogenesis protein|uniref:phage virion morphogenesis protein n=1 Tax=Shewanella sp. SM73 TaxID=2912806 RepID=UPI0021D8CC58|nr:phage virion morphogenesis protein [Shewanella sp. SM73]MCU8031783.1 phage virion morphogenesis protein [Shewanella sp. SM73]
MAGTQITITEHGFEGALTAFQQLIDRGQDLQPALSAIAEYLRGSTQDRITAGESPDGTPFAALSDFTLGAKSRNQDKILIERGYLYNLVYQVSSEQMQLGSNMVYAAMHQFGGTTAPNSMIPNKDIPAREFLGVSQDDEIEIIATVGDYLMA